MEVFQVAEWYAKIDFYMGAYGHKAKRPTTAATNYGDIAEMDGNFEWGESCVLPSLLKRSEMRKWSKEFKAILANNIFNCSGTQAGSDEGPVGSDVNLSKLTKEQRPEWRDHIHNDHQPYRPDCSVCIMPRLQVTTQKKEAAGDVRPRS